MEAHPSNAHPSSVSIMSGGAKKDLSDPAVRILDWNKIHPRIIDPDKAYLRFRSDWHLTAKIILGETLSVYTADEVLQGANKLLQEAQSESAPPRKPENFALEKFAFYYDIVATITRTQEALIDVKDETDGDWIVVSAKATSQPERR